VVAAAFGQTSPRPPYEQVIGPGTFKLRIVDAFRDLRTADIYRGAENLGRPTRIAFG
jgi:hypothetical protein